MKCGENCKVQTNLEHKCIEKKIHQDSTEKELLREIINILERIEQTLQ